MATRSELVKSRGHAKRLITRKMNEIIELMEDNENMSAVKGKSTELDDLYVNFVSSHEELNQLIEDEDEQEISNVYCEQVKEKVTQLQENVKLWITGIETSNYLKDMDLDLDDSISNHGSTSSTRSVLSEARAQASAKKAMLEAEQATIQKLHELELQELQLRQRKENITLSINQAKAEAEEKAYAQAEMLNYETPHGAFMPQSPRAKNDSTVVKEQPIALLQQPPQETPTTSRRMDPSIQEWRYEAPVINHPQHQPYQSSPFISSSSEVQRLMFQQQEAIMALTLPQPSVPIFDGDPTQYCDFTRAFENLIERKTSSPSSRLYYLVQYTTGQVQELVRSCLSMKNDEGYAKAKKLLKERYGQGYKIASAFIDKLTARPQIKAEDGPALERFSTTLTSCCNTLKEVGYLNRLDSPDGLKRIVNILPFGLRQKWRDVVDNVVTREDRDPTVRDLETFVKTRARSANHPIFGQLQLASETKPTGNSTANVRTPRMKARTFAAEAENTTTRSQSCPLCNNTHWLSQCSQFKDSSLEERISMVRNKNLCMNCLTPGHFVRNCKKKSFCRVKDCTMKHSTFLHKPASSTSQQPSTSSNEPNNNQAHNAFTNSVKAFNSIKDRKNPAIGLPIVPVKVKGQGRTKEILTYALLDSGSNTTFCTESLLKKLDLKGSKSTLSLTTLHRKDEETQCSLVSLEVSGINDKDYVQLPMVYSRVSLPISKENIGKQEDVNQWPQLHGVRIPNIDADIGLLIGSDVPDVLSPKETKVTCKGGPCATRTVLGWTLNGPLGRREKSISTTNFAVTTDELSKQFTEYCNREFNDSSYKTEQQSMSQNDKRALSIMTKSIELVNGHYQLALPWREYPPRLTNNRSMAEHRLGLLKKRLQRDPETLVKYKNFMDDLLEKRYAQKVKDSQERKETWYLPHHPVFHPQKPGKVRVVFDCSAKHRGTSLNDQLLQGPDLTNTLVGVLMRFRQEPIAFMADIEAMFYQVRVRPEDCNYLRFLWWPDGDVEREPEEYQMLVHLFGGASSPSCANYALKRTAEDNADEFDKTTIQTVKENFYVDDCLRSVSTEKEAIQLSSQLRALLDKGGFRLTKWMSNSLPVLDSIPQSERATSVRNLDFNNESLMERALGVQWNVHEDTFSYRIATKDKPPTRRGILSIVSSVYDPLGFVSPAILPAKAILQDLCQKGLGWDDEIPESERKRWESWLEDLPKLEGFTVPRCFKPSDFSEVKRRELHHFADASTQGYGAVSYLRQIDANGKVSCSLIAAKSRLAPIKTMTIPRLELSAAVLATRLDRMILQELTVPIASSTFWTDSTCVLRYIENMDKRFQTFVANRVASILEQSTVSQWRYVDTLQNPADDASRGMSVEALLKDDRWSKGPAFLAKLDHAWPKRPADMGRIPSNDPEVKRTAETHATVTVEGNDPLENIFTKFSQWTKLKKTIAWILRYKNNLLKRVRENKKKEQIKETKKNDVTPITVSEMKKAEIVIIKYVQRQCFEEELRNLNAGCLTKKASSLHKLDPMLLDDLIRVGGRLQRAPIGNDAKHPIILPKDHHISRLIICFYHHVSAHSGVEYTLSLIRQSYWIVGARTNVRNIVSKCFDCRRRQAPVMQQKMASLPENRATPSRPPFTYVGVDCFGPFIVRRGRTNAKRYGVLFTCLTIRAVHIEVVHSLDTESFINALRRFIARRGQPEEMRSDNGGNFVKGERELREEIEAWNQDQIHEFLLQRTVKWIFNPPAASHHGGVWERCIRTVRKVMKALLKEQTLDDESLNTLMCEVESIINGRPITKVSDDPKDLEALTPNHLLLLRAGTVMPPGVFCKDDIYSRRRWRQVQYLSNVFWRRWIKEYLPSLQQRQKWNKPHKNLSVNDIVLILDDTTPRSVWPLGRVLEVYTSQKDGLVRSAKVRTRNTALVRPVDKIILLEAAENVPEKD